MQKKRGKPVIHPPIIILETGQIFSTYKEVAEAIGGDKSNVYRCLELNQESHKGFHFEYVTN